MTTIMITGIARGIGFELARQAKGKGWNVIGSVRSEEDASRVKEQIPGATILQFDVADFDKVEEASNTLEAPIDILINNAGIISPERQSSLDMDFDGFANTLQVNTLAPLKVTQSFLPQVRKGNNPRIVMISSAMGLMQHANSGRIAYRTSKAAINKVSQCLATDLRDEEICVVSMHPGWVQSDMGGPQADITPEASAGGILNVVEHLTIEDTCSFINWDGQRMDW